VEAYGLAASLFQSQQEVWKSDVDNKQILRHTDPERLRASLQQLKEPLPSDLPKAKESELDIILTGVGGIDDSLFRDYCEKNELDIGRLTSELQLVGDIGYHPVTALGSRVTLSSDYKKKKARANALGATGDTKTGRDGNVSNSVTGCESADRVGKYTEYEFYSVVSLDVFERMSSNSEEKRVIVIARNRVGRENTKTEIIHAAIKKDSKKGSVSKGKTRYCNVLITDSYTAQHVLAEFHGEARHRHG
jgi:hypothetical protein